MLTGRRQHLQQRDELEEWLLALPAQPTREIIKVAIKHHVNTILFQKPSQIGQ